MEAELAHIGDRSFKEQLKGIVKRFLAGRKPRLQDLLTALSEVAFRQKRRVRFATATSLINELVDAQHEHELGLALKQ